MFAEIHEMPEKTLRGREPEIEIQTRFERLSCALVRENKTELDEIACPQRQRRDVAGVARSLPGLRWLEGDNCCL